MLLVVLLVTCCVVLALWSWMKPRTLPSPPVYPGALPIIGHGHRLLGDAQQMWNAEKGLYDYCLQKEDIVEVRLGSHSIYVISDPDDSFTIANKCLEKPYMYHFGKEMYDRGLVTATTSVWKPHRRLLNPAFNQQVLYTFVEEYIVQAKRLVSQLASEEGKEPFDVLPCMIKNLLGTACRTSLGLEADEDMVTLKDYALATEDLFALYLNRIRRVWLHFQYIFNWTSYKKKQDSLMKVMKDITEAVITNRKSDLKSIDNLDKTKNTESAKFKPLLDQMLDLADKQDAFTEEEIRQHLDTIIAAAYETTATAITFILILIGSHRDVQERMYKELQEVFGNQERDLNRHDLPKLVYLEAVIKETLRVYPPAPMIARCSSTDVQLIRGQVYRTTRRKSLKIFFSYVPENYTIPANSTFLISLYGLNRHSSWGADADQFKPERWLDQATLPENSNTFASFSLGKRNCIGKLYGMMAIKTNLAYILKQYRIKSDIDKLVTRCDLLLKPIAGHLISLESRT